MRSLYFILGLIPLALAASTGFKEKCECPKVKCPGEQPAQCRCLNGAAIACAKKCGIKPTTTQCPKSTMTTATPSPTPTYCGTPITPPCPDERQTCIADPDNLGCSFIADCAGVCVILDGQTCGGFAGLDCPSGQTCVDDPRDDCDLDAGGADCSGVCVYRDGRSAAPMTPAGEFCGGIGNLQCPQGKACVDNPNDSCDPTTTGRDCGGICVPTTGQLCGVRGSSPCPEGKRCIDKPDDGCDPVKTADCPGICV